MIWSVLKSDRLFIAALCGLLAMKDRKLEEDGWWMWAVLSLMNVTTAVANAYTESVKKRAA